MKTLILNVDYSPLSMVHVNRGIVLSFKTNMKVLQYYDAEYKSERGSVKVPAVILYDRYVQRKQLDRPSKRAILLRDRMECQYCGIKLQQINATIDHVKPASLFKKREHSNTWDNLVACCLPCNSHKNKRTPEQAGMRLRNKPKIPHGFLIQEIMPDEWKNFVKL